MTAATPVRSGPNARADARRNRALVLAAAQRAFVEFGTEVSLAEIARRAGVGAGTVHRHFPSKNHLLEAVMQLRIDRLTALALGYRDAPDAGAAYFAFCAEVVTSTIGNGALCELFDNDGWPRDGLREAGERFHLALGQLLAAAQRQHAVRGDLTVPDVLALFTGCVAIQRISTAQPGLARPAALVLEAMRATTPERRVTKPRNPAAARDENAPRNVTALCPVCATPLRPTGTGRPARYCSPACRQKAHRRRHSVAAAGTAADAVAGAAIGTAAIADTGGTTAIAAAGATAIAVGATVAPGRHTAN
ncbi:TetR/AcrR family transcriptional regulator [Nocardia sp. NBC_01327]|uniref:TetR/AcrR family transcriptional regulator n=1 Tax=Nocardia sp. NBC_01327 TaxID=2903593 RepID=UPI002E141A8A|nr:TetR/AcrR family transcriptional regulator [Nocardia sp. NBC_01327]